MRGLKFFALLFAVSSAAYAGDETRTLPKGRFGVRLNNVFVTGTDYQFTQDGSRRTVADAHATSIKDQAINTANGAINGSNVGKMIYDQVIRAMQATNVGQFGLNTALSALQAMDLGQMKTQVTPTATVTSPTLMYGVTDSWSLVVNVPFVKIHQDVSWEYVPGSSTSTLNTASALANAAGISAIPNSSQFVSMAQTALADKGYKPLQSSDKTFVGDVRVMNLFDLGRIGALSFGAMSTLNLPTGPAHDADDLTDVGAFHHSFVEQELTLVYKFTRKFRSYASGAVRYNLPEKTDFRVPNGEFDLDPDVSQKENLTRQIGFGTMIEGGFKYRVLPRFDFKAGLAHSTKDGDKFSGSMNLRYDVLANTYPYTAESSTSYKLALSYDPLSNYQMGSIPLMADLNYEEVFSGVNTPAMKTVMLSLATFF